jgi:hypothetical protein
MKIVIGGTVVVEVTLMIVDTVEVSVVVQGPR